MASIKIKPRPTGPKGAATQRTRRVLLPSERVAEFALPNVGEWLQLREEALRDAARALGNKTPTDMEIGLALGQVSLRRLLVGITVDPVPSIFKPGFNAAESRARLQAEGVSADMLQPAIDLAIEKAEIEAEDVDKMKAAANLQPVNDLEWDTETSTINRMRNAAMNTAEAVDYQALVDFAMVHLPAVLRSADDGPKAKTRPMR